MPDHVPPLKTAVRQFFRDSDREAEWTELQGIAYGRGMERAEPFAGALEFVRSAVARGLTVKIISHRTKYPIKGDQTDLHASALDWLQREGFVGAGALSVGDLFFEITKRDKLRRISEQACSVFLDDLPEILDAKLFPDGCEGWLFAPSGSDSGRRQVVTDWPSFARIIL